MKKKILLLSALSVFIFTSCNEAYKPKPINKDGTEHNVDDKTGATTDGEDHSGETDPMKNINMKFSSQKYTIEVGQKYLTTMSFDNEHSNYSLRYTSENEDIVSINDKGEITGKKSGVTHIFVKDVNGKGQAFATVYVSTQIPDGVVVSGDNLVKWPNELIPSDSIIILPTSIKNIGRVAFQDCQNLKQIIFSDSLRSIGASAFEECYSLKSINVPSNVTLGIKSFSNSGLYKVVLSEGVRFPSYVGQTFMDCAYLEDIELPSDLENIPDATFMGCSSLTKLSLPSTITKIARDAFARCEYLKTISISENNENYCVDNGVLFDKNKSVLFLYPADKEDASYIIPESVSTLNEYSFAYTKNLETLTVSDKVKNIWNTAFSNSNIETITINKDMDIKVLGRKRVIEYDGKLFVPAQYLENYQGSIAWSSAQIKAIQ